MTYSECADHIGGILGKIDWSDTEDCSLQFNIIGSDNGGFYIIIRDHEADIKVIGSGESGETDKYGDSYENTYGHTYNVKIVVTAPVLSRLLMKVIDPIYAYTTGKFKMKSHLEEKFLSSCAMFAIQNQYNKRSYQQLLISEYC